MIETYEEALSAFRNAPTDPAPSPDEDERVTKLEIPPQSELPMVTEDEIVIHDTEPTMAAVRLPDYLPDSDAPPFDPDAITEIEVPVPQHKPEPDDDLAVLVDDDERLSRTRISQILLGKQPPDPGRTKL